MYDVITIGSNTVDLFAHTDLNQLISIKTNESAKEYISYPVGSKILITKLLHNFGGNGMNSAIAFSRLGFRTAYVGKVGKDENGRLILGQLKKEKVSFIGSRGDESGFSIILDAMEEDRTILGYKGCNNDLTYDELQVKKMKAKWFYISSMLGESLATLKKIIEDAKRCKAKIAFNPSMTIIDNDHKSAMKLVSHSDVIVLNKEEAESLAIGKTLEDSINKIVKLGPSIVVITDGKDGALAYKDRRLYKVLPRKDLKIVETTGAGDSFASTLIAGIMMNKPFETCLLMAINNSEAVITGHGAQPRLITKKEMLNIISRDKRTVLVTDADF